MRSHCIEGEGMRIGSKVNHELQNKQNRDTDYVADTADKQNFSFGHTLYTVHSIDKNRVDAVEDDKDRGKRQQIPDFVYCKHTESNKPETEVNNEEEVSGKEYQANCTEYHNGDQCAFS